MKQDINLAYKRPANKKAAKGALFTLLILAVLGGLSYAALTIPQLFKTAALANQNSLTQRLASLSDTEKKYNDSLKIKTDLLSNIDMLKELETNKKDMLDVLHKIEDSCPDGVEMTSMIFNPDSISLSGYSNSDVELASFVANLNTVEDFTNVIVNKTENDTVNNTENYTLTILYTVPLRAEPVTQSKENAQPSASSSPSAQTDNKEAK